MSPCVCILNKKETREEYYLLPTLSVTSKNLEGSGNLKEDMAALLSPSWLGRLTTLLHKEDLMQLTDGKHTVLTLLPNLTNLSTLSVFLLKWKKTLIHHFLSHSLPPSCSHGLWHSLKEPNPAHHISSSFRLYPWSVQMQTVFWVPVPQLYWEAATFQAKEANWITDKTSFNSWK